MKGLNRSEQVCRVCKRVHGKDGWNPRHMFQPMFPDRPAREDDNQSSLAVGNRVRLRDGRTVVIVGPVTEGYMHDTVVVAARIEHVRTTDVCEVTHAD